MSSSPKIYRVYSFDLAQHAVTADFISAADDAEAIAAAQGADFGHKCEIWHERRLVAQLEAERRQA